MKKLILTALLLTACTANAQSYKCTINGQTTYTDRDCSSLGGKTEKVLNEKKQKKSNKGIGGYTGEQLGEAVACGVLFGGVDAVLGTEAKRECQDSALKRGKYKEK